MQGQHAQLQRAYSELDTYRSKLEKELHEERLEHQASKSTLHFEQYCHGETKKHVECIWTTAKRIQDLYSKESKPVGDEECSLRKMQFEVADLLIDSEEKQRLIVSLQTELKGKSQGVLCCEKEMEHRKTMFKAVLAEKDKRISELEGSLQEAQVNKALLIKRGSTVRKAKKESTE